MILIVIRESLIEFSGISPGSKKSWADGVFALPKPVHSVVLLPDGARAAPMTDLEKVIQQLRKRKEAIERTIVELEELLALEAGKVRRNGRGRKSMGEAERQQVSSRMKAYWEKRRQH